MSPNDLNTPIIHVVAGVVIDAAGRVLIAQRPAGKHLAGGWEFPGGKLEPGEARRAGLARELREELGIGIREPRPLIRVRHVYPYGEVLLDVWVVRRYHGNPEGLDGQAIRWCLPGELAGARLLPADRPIVSALRLPEILRRRSTSDYEVVESALPRSLAAECGGDTAGGTGEGNERTAGHGVDGIDGAGAFAAVVGVDGDGGDGSSLNGVFCRTAAQAVATAAGGADFLVLRERVESLELAALCDAVAVPVYAVGLGLERAWELGASGINEIGGG